MTTQVYVGASSPLLTYSTTGGVWTGVEGGAACAGSCAVQIDSVDFLSATFYFSASSSLSLQVGLDGALASASATGGSCAASASTFASHSARLEVSGAEAGAFVLSGVVLETEVVSSGTASNATLDDASAAITYSGFTSTSGDGAGAPAVSGAFYDGTVSYTATAGAAASFAFDGSALYMFGLAGPSMGSYSVAIDNATSATYNASTPAAGNVADALLFFVTGLGDAQHTATLTAEGGLVGLDYAVAVGAGTASATGTAAAGGGGGGATGAIVGGVLGTLGGLFLLWLAYRYRASKKAGGTGDCFTMLFGAPKRPEPPPAKKEASQWKIWPYLKYQPKYAKGPG